jgi:hypothetical protein
MPEEAGIVQRKGPAAGTSSRRPGWGIVVRTIRGRTARFRVTKGGPIAWNAPMLQSFKKQARDLPTHHFLTFGILTVNLEFASSAAGR